MLEAGVELLLRALAGSAAARSDFVERYAPYLRACVDRAFRRAGYEAGPQDVEDMLGDLWVSMLDDDMRMLRQFDPRRSQNLAVWLGIIARNKTIDRIRTTHFRPGRFDDSILEQPSDHPTPTHRRFLEALYLRGYEPEELARELGVLTVSVYSRRCKLQQKLARKVRRLVSQRR